MKTSPNAFTGQDTFIHRSNFDFVRVLFEIQKKNRRQYPYPNDGHPSAILKLWIAFNESVETVSVEVLQSGITVNVQFQIKHCIFLFHLMVY